MAKASWVLVNPSTGSGNGSVSVSSAAAHTGRVARQSSLTITAADCEDVYVTVNQAGKPVYVDSADSATAAKAGQNVTISGTSNAAKLTFSLGTGALEVSLPEKYTAAGIETDNGVAIAGDPGATAEYNFSIVINVPENGSIEELSKQIIVSDGEGHQDVCTLTQAAGDATLSVSKTQVDLAYTGEAVSFDVTSNTTWSIA